MEAREHNDIEAAIESSAPTLPLAWLEGRSQCVPDQQAFIPATPSAEELLQWFKDGVARQLIWSPTPSLHKPHFVLCYEVLCFDTNGSEVWRAGHSKPFLCSSYEEATTTLKRIGLWTYTTLSQ